MPSWGLGEGMWPHHNISSLMKRPGRSWGTRDRVSLRKKRKKKRLGVTLQLSLVVKRAQEDSAWTLKNLPGHWRLWGSVRLYQVWFSCRLGESFRLDHRLRGHLSTACLLGGSWGAAPGVWLCRAKQQPGERLCRVSNSQGLELPKNKRCFKHLWWCLCDPKGWC